MSAASPRRLSRRTLALRGAPRRAWRATPLGVLSDPHARLAALARSRAPLRRAFAALAGRLVEGRGWERLGFARLADYARERLGLAARTLQDLARTDAALTGLPRIEAAFVGGELTWTQVRLLARVAGPEDEAAWLALALHRSCEALAREVRAVDVGSMEGGAAAAIGDVGNAAAARPAATETDEDGIDEEARAAVRIRCAPRVRARWHAAFALARRVSGENLPRWEAMEAIAAEVLSAFPLGPGLGADASDCGASAEEGASLAHGLARRGVRDGGGDGREARSAAARASYRGAADACVSHAARAGPSAPGEAARDGAAPVELPANLARLVADLEQADPFELDARLRAALALEQRLDAHVARLLARVAGERLYRDEGFRCLEDYARARLGLAPRKARALLRLERAGSVCPELRRAWRDARLSWVRAHTLVPLVALDHAGPWRRAWVERAGRVSVRRLEEDVGAALVLAETDPGAFAATGGIPRDGEEDRPEGRQTGAFATDADPSGPGPAPVAREAAWLFWTAPVASARFFRSVLCSLRRRLERAAGRLPSEGDALDAMFEHVFHAWTVRDPSWRTAHAVFQRDGWRCTVPGCSSFKNLHDHHVVFRSRGGSNALENRTTLCAWHHLRGIHRGVVHCTGRAPRRLRFELGVRAGRPPLVAYGPGEVMATA